MSPGPEKPHVPGAAERRRLFELTPGAATASLPSPDEIIRTASGILATKVAILERSGGAWSALAEAGEGSPLEGVDPEAPGHVPGAGWWLHHDGAWTFLRAGHGPVVLAVEGDWTSSIPALAPLARAVDLSLRAQARARRSRAQRAAHRLARRLAPGGPDTGPTIVAAVASLLRARVASLSVPDPEGRQLTVAATYGYPLELVKHLAIQPGAGVIGSVYESGRPLRAADVTSLTGVQQYRRRYRTKSLLVFPLKAGGETVGVVSVSDRLDDRPFTRDDLSACRALAAPAALALAAERARAQAQSFAHAAAVDPVSGLFNRRYFHVRIEEELQRASRHKMPVALLMIDLDDFKTVNDTYGHLAGDAVIRETADIVRRSVRMFDVCTRFGGEEFAIVMPGSGPESAARVAERIRQGVERYRSAELVSTRITVSIGVAVTSEEMTAGDLIARADQALYAAKRAGKNQVRAAGWPPPENPAQNPAPPGPLRFNRPRENQP